jgi:hypothetical protein
VHINCAATDVPYLMGSARDGGWDLSTARKCVEKKCPDYMNGTTSEIGSNESASMQTFVFNKVTDKGKSREGE